MFFSRVRIKDDRGTPVDVFDPSSTGVHKQSLPQDAELDALVSKIVIDKSLDFSQGLAICALWLLSSVLLTLLSIAFLGTFLPGVSQLIQYTLVGCALVLWTLFLVACVRREKALITVNTLLSNGRCGTCASNAFTTVVDQDECNECPRCGSVWKTRRRLNSPTLRASRSPKETTNKSAASFFKQLMFYRSPTYFDGEQHEVSILNPTLHPPPARIPAEIIPNLLPLIRRRTKAIRFFTVGLLALCLFTYSGQLFREPQLHLQDLMTLYQRSVLLFAVRLIGLTVAVIFIPLLIYRTWTFRTSITVDEVVKALLELNLCPACGSPLPTSTPPIDPVPPSSPTVPDTHSPLESAPPSPQAKLTRCTHCAAAWAPPSTAKS